jgi:L-amino acid N-acyltransferase YncA
VLHFFAAIISLQFFMMIRSAHISDAAAICAIYNYYVRNTTVTFEEEAVQPEEMAARITEVTEKFPWLVYEAEGKVVGYAYASAWKSRCAYKYSVEVTVYLENGYQGKGAGSALYAQLLGLLAKQKIHAAIGGVALPNEGSVALHQKFGFEKVAQFKEVGYKFEKWIDVTYWEKILLN